MMKSFAHLATLGTLGPIFEAVYGFRLILTSKFGDTIGFSSWRRRGQDRARPRREAALRRLQARASVNTVVPTAESGRSAGPLMEPADDAIAAGRVGDDKGRGVGFGVLSF